MTNYPEELRRAVESRCNALLSLRSLKELKETAEQRREDLLPILLGDGIDIGILDLIHYWAEQIRLAGSRKTSTPDFSSDYAAAYKADMARCVTAEGDREGGLYPPDKDFPERASRDFNKDSVWVGSFSLEAIGSETGEGVKTLCQGLIDSIGETATATANARGSYETQEEAEEQANIDRGSGYLALRTENSEVYLNTSSSTYSIGRDGIDTPDNMTFRQDLLSKIDKILGCFDSLDIVLSKSIDIISQPGRILEEFRVELPTNKAEMLSLRDQITEDTDTLIEYKSYFSSVVSDVSTREAINSRLKVFKSGLESILQSYETYADTVSAYLGNKTKGVRKSLVYWVEELVKKPDGCYATLEGIKPVYPDVQKALENADTRLSFLTDDKTEWILPTKIMGVFNQAVLNLDKSVKRWETKVVWNGVQAANKYRLLSKEVDTFDGLSNDPWTSDYKEVEISSLNEGGFLDSEATISLPEKNTLFRIVACEEADGVSIERTDSFNTSSHQSDILSDSISFTLLEDVNDCTALQISEENMSLFSLRETDFILLDTELAQIKSISENTLLLDKKYENFSSIRKLFGFYYATEL